MKNIILSAAAILIVMTTANAQTSLMTTVYRHVSDADIMELKDKSVVFTWNEKGARYRAFFTEGGVWQHTLVSYEGGQLQAGVRNLIRRTYSDLPIYYVDEVRTPGENTVYRVQLQDEKKLVIVKVSGDEMEKEVEYRK